MLDTSEFGSRYVTACSLTGAQPLETAATKYARKLNQIATLGATQRVRALLWSMTVTQSWHWYVGDPGGKWGGSGGGSVLLDGLWRNSNLTRGTSHRLLEPMWGAIGTAQLLYFRHPGHSFDSVSARH